MPGPESAINPIVQAMLNTAQLSQRARAQGEEERSNKANEAARQQQLKQAQTQIENEAEYRKSSLDLESQRQQLEHDMASLNATKMLGDLHAQGFDLSKLGFPQVGSQPSQLNAGSATLPDFQQAAQPEPIYQGPAGVRFTQSGFPSPESSLALEMKKAQGLQNIKTAGEKEVLGTQIAGQKDIEGMREASEAKLEGVKNLSQQQIAKMGRDAELAVARMRNDTELRIAGLTGSNEANPQLQNLIIGGLTGQIKLNPSNPIERAAMSSIVANGGHLPAAGDITALKQMQTLGDSFFKQANDFANTLPSERTLGTMNAKAQAYVNGKIAETELPTDMKNKLNMLRTNAMNYGKIVEGLTGGRVSNTQLGMAVDGMVSGGQTREMAQQTIANLQDQYQNKEENNIMGGMPDFQKKLLYKTNGIKPAWLRFAPPTNPVGHKLDEDTSMQVGRPVYSGGQ